MCLHKLTKFTLYSNHFRIVIATDDYWVFYTKYEIAASNHSSGSTHSIDIRFGEIDYYESLLDCGIFALNDIVQYRIMSGPEYNSIIMLIYFRSYYLIWLAHSNLDMIDNNYFFLDTQLRLM